MNDWFDAESHADRALEMYERGRLAEAEAELRKALSLNPDQPEWHFNLGLTLEAGGRDADALVSYEHAIELMEGQPEPLMAAGVCCLRLERYTDAIERLDAAISIDPTCDGVYAHKMEAHLRLGQLEDVETTHYLSQLASDQPDPQALAILAEALIEQSRHTRAEWCLKEALRCDPSMPRLRARLAAIYSATNRRQRALQMYLRDLRDDPGNIDTLLDYGELLFELGRLPEAAEKFRRVLELEPANVDAHYRIGMAAMTARRYEAAHLEFELVLKLDPSLPSIRLCVGEAAVRRGRIETGRRHLLDEIERISQLQPAEIDTDLRRLGDLMTELKMPDQAAAVYEIALLREPDAVDLWRCLALAQFQQGNATAGDMASQRALALDPECIVSMHNLALSALNAGRVNEADELIRRGLTNGPDDPGLRRLRIRLWGDRIAALIARLRRRD